MLEAAMSHVEPPLAPHTHAAALPLLRPQRERGQGQGQQQRRRQQIAAMSSPPSSRPRPASPPPPPTPAAAATFSNHLVAAVQSARGALCTGGPATPLHLLAGLLLHASAAGEGGGGGGGSSGVCACIQVLASRGLPSTAAALLLAAARVRTRSLGSHAAEEEEAAGGGGGAAPSPRAPLHASTAHLLHTALWASLAQGGFWVWVGVGCRRRSRWCTFAITLTPIQPHASLATPHSERRPRPTSMPFLRRPLLHARPRARGPPGTARVPPG